MRDVFFSYVSKNYLIILEFFFLKNTMKIVPTFGLVWNRKKPNRRFFGSLQTLTYYHIFWWEILLLNPFIIIEKLGSKERHPLPNFVHQTFTVGKNVQKICFPKAKKQYFFNFLGTKNISWKMRWFQHVIFGVTFKAQ